jgi:DNA-directed RNA polymerase specialized sigma24 family protein
MTCRAIVRFMSSLLRYLRNLQRYLRRRGESPERAEDLVQEAYLRMQLYCKEGGAVREPGFAPAGTSLVDDCRKNRRQLK